MTAGFARIDITPPLDRIEAYGLGYWYQRSVRFTGVRDALYVRTLVLGTGAYRQVIVSVDSILDTYGFGPQATATICAALDVDPSAVFITCTHTHSSPLIERNDTMQGAEYGPFVAELIVRSAIQARDNSAEADVSVSRGRVTDVLYNRRPLLRNGRIAELHQPVDSGQIVDAGPVNDCMTIVQFRRPDGKLMGGLCHFGIHGVAVQCSDLISSDCMGRAIQAAERETGGSVLLHLNASCGDIDPVRMGSDEALEEMTVRLLRGVLHVLHADKHGLPQPESGWATARRFRARRRATRSPQALAEARAALIGGGISGEAHRHHSGAGYEAFLLAEEARVGALPPEFDIPWQLVGLGGVVLAGIGGEVFTRFGLALQQAADGITVLPVGLTGGAAGYLPAHEMYTQGGYEVACAQWCPIAPGEPERLFSEISSDLRRAAGSRTS